MATVHAFPDATSITNFLAASYRLTSGAFHTS
jgi:hypothetical protein